ncbi:MAG: DUF5615 family PIN-like protein [Desulfobacterales bacterium]|nr:DUF5615 family PIN-like protein [Desulfobacterales bacterium]
MKYYLDEDISPKVSALLRKQKVDAVSTHEVGRTQSSDIEHLKYAVSEGKALVTRNRDDFIRLSVRFFNDSRSHFGVLIIPHAIPGDNFSLIAKALEKYACEHPKGMEPYTIDFLG